jgi:hypothetical protein
MSEVVGRARRQTLRIAANTAPAAAAFQLLEVGSPATVRGQRLAAGDDPVLVRGGCPQRVRGIVAVRSGSLGPERAVSPPGILQKRIGAVTALVGPVQELAASGARTWEHRHRIGIGREAM